MNLFIGDISESCLTFFIWQYKEKKKKRKDIYDEIIDSCMMSNFKKSKIQNIYKSYTNRKPDVKIKNSDQ